MLKKKKSEFYPSTISFETLKLKQKNAKNCKLMPDFYYQRPKYSFETLFIKICCFSKSSCQHTVDRSGLKNAIFQGKMKSYFDAQIKVFCDTIILGKQHWIPTHSVSAAGNTMTNAIPIKFQNNTDKKLIFPKYP